MSHAQSTGSPLCISTRIKSHEIRCSLPFACECVCVCCLCERVHSRYLFQTYCISYPFATVEKIRYEIKCTIPCTHHSVVVMIVFFLSAAIRPQKRPAPRKRSCENNISVCCVYSVAVHWPESDGTIYLLMMFDEHSLISNCVCTIVWYTAVRTYRRYLVYARALFVRLDSHREWGVLLCCSAHKSPLSHIADRH